MITIIGNESLNRLNYYVWKSAIDAGLVEYLSTSKAFNPNSSSKITVLSYISVAEIDEIYLKAYCRNGGILILYLFDSFSTFPEWLQSIIIKYNSNGILKEVFSFDTADCCSYGFSYWPQICSMLKTVRMDNKPGFYFAGRNKGRFDLIRKIAESFYNNSNSNAHIRIPDIEENDATILRRIGNVVLDNFMIPYELMLNEELSYNCIFDLTQDCQKGLSWRFVEGIMYGKKIVTNNPNVMSSPFYNDSQVRIIRTPNDLDFEWIENISIVSNIYDDSYSPIRFINKIKKYE